jgi:hypothetical protein
LGEDDEERRICGEPESEVAVSSERPDMVLTASPMTDRATVTPTAGVSVEQNEEEETVTFTIVDEGNVDFFYLSGNHRYSNHPVLCGGDEVTFRDLDSQGRLHLVGVIKKAGKKQSDIGNVMQENGTWVLTEVPQSGSRGFEAVAVVQITEYDFTED